MGDEDLTVREGTIADLTPDPENANRGTERGAYMLARSLQQYGAGRSIVTDRNGVVLAGNHALETCGELGIEDTIVVPTDGTKLVVVQRTDLDTAADPARARGYALSDNRTGQVNLSFDPAALLEAAELGAPVADYWTEDELREIGKDAKREARLSFSLPDASTSDGEAQEAASGAGRDANDPERFPLAVVLSMADYRRWQSYRRQQGAKTDTEAFLRLLELAEL